MDFSQFPGRKNSKKCKQGTGQSTRDKMYVKWFETKMTVSKIFTFAAGSDPRTSRRSQGTEHGSRHRPEEIVGDAAGGA
ncbi:unnamed protein product, partial [Staurois parvus]